MSELSANYTGGLAPEQDLVLPRCPGNPEMRESVSVWLFEDSGYEGVYDLEVIGPAVEEEGYESSLRRGVPAASALLAAMDL